MPPSHHLLYHLLQHTLQPLLGPLLQPPLQPLLQLHLQPLPQLLLQLLPQLLPPELYMLWRMRVKRWRPFSLNLCKGLCYEHTLLFLKIATISFTELYMLWRMSIKRWRPFSLNPSSSYTIYSLFNKVLWDRTRAHKHTQVVKWSKVKWPR